MKGMKFMKKSKRNLFLLGALALALVITGGMFAGAWFSAANDGSITTEADFADVSATALTITDVQGGESGNVAAQTIFTITPAGNYTGELLVTVYLTNAPDLTSTFESLQLKVKSAFQGGGLGLTDWQIISLDNESVIIPVTGYTGGTPFDVTVEGGTWHAQPDIATNDPDLDLYCEVSQRGLD